MGLCLLRILGPAIFLCVMNVAIFFKMFKEHSAEIEERYNSLEERYISWPRISDVSQTTEADSGEGGKRILTEADASEGEKRNNWPGIPVENVGHALVEKGKSFVDHAREFLLANNNELLDEFLDIYSSRSDKINLCGIRVNHAYSLFLAIKQLRPKAIIESGVNAGVSTYIMRMAAGDETIIYAMDPEDEPICEQEVRWVDPNPNTINLTGKQNFKDLTQVNWSTELERHHISPKDVLIFLDDHLVVFDRLIMMYKVGFRHVLIEDNYKKYEGSTTLDKRGFTPKQMFHRTDDDSKFLFRNTVSYKEFPPLVPPIMAKENKVPRKRAGGFMVASDSNKDIVAPILRPDLDINDMKIYNEICTKLDIDPTGR